MLLILLEALGAGLLLVFIVWWTMFSGRPPSPPADPAQPDAPPPPPLPGQDARSQTRQDATKPPHRPD